MKATFQKLLAVMVILLVFVYCFAVTFLKIPVDNLQPANIVLGTLLGILGTIATFYWGSSDRSRPQAPSNTETAKVELTKAEEVKE